ncbi:hypothetical protein BJ912DRAFT_934477 [Pholiota molesta]|nr:hypothetical protein BJ912DRAFT_934477 [Pholiota molesta]
MPLPPLEYLIASRPFVPPDRNPGHMALCNTWRMDYTEGRRGYNTSPRLTSPLRMHALVSNIASSRVLAPKFNQDTRRWSLATYHTFVLLILWICGWVQFRLQPGALLIDDSLKSVLVDTLRGVPA